MDIDRIERIFFMDVNGYTVNIPYLFQQRGIQQWFNPQNSLDLSNKHMAGYQ